MQAIQDKDFDKLFKDGLENAEISPSKELWRAIEAEVTPKKKAFSLRYWLVAASILILGLITLVIYRSQNVYTQNNVAIKKRVSAERRIINNYNATVTPPINSGNHKPQVQVASNVLKLKSRIRIDRNIPEPGQINFIEEIELPVSEQTKLAQDVMVEPTKPIISESPKEEKIVLASVEENKSVVLEVEKSPTNKIKNAGDLINLVVNTVDKSKNKFIRFKTNDEGSTLASINIGPFRFGKHDD